MKGKYRHFLENKTIKRWYDNICRGSILTGDVYLNKVGYFCLMNGTTPQELAKMSKRKVYNMLLDMVTDFESKKRSGGYIQSILKSVKSWMRFNGKKIEWDIRINGLNKRPTLVDQRTPTQKELGRIFLAGNLKARVACSLVAHSGFRIGVLGKYKGEDGLMVKDFLHYQIPFKDPT